MGRENPGEGGEEAWDPQGKGRAPQLAPGPSEGQVVTPAPQGAGGRLREVSPAR